MKQGPFARTGLCCPSRRHYYDPLRLPLDRSPLPGITGYKRACFPPPQTGAEEALSSSQDNLLTVPRPIRREVLEHPLQDPKCCPWPSPSKCRLGSPLARSREILLRRRRLHFMLRTGQLPPPQRDVVAPLRHRTLTRRREPRYRGPWHLPGPDSHRLAALSLSLGYVMTPPR